MLANEIYIYMDVWKRKHGFNHRGERGGIRGREDETRVRIRILGYCNGWRRDFIKDETKERERERLTVELTFNSATFPLGTIRVSSSSRGGEKGRPIYLSQREVNRDINAETWPRSKDRVQTKLDFHCERGGLIRSFLCLEAPAASLNDVMKVGRDGRGREEKRNYNRKYSNEEKKKVALRYFRYSIFFFFFLIEIYFLFFLTFSYTIPSFYILFLFNYAFRDYNGKIWRGEIKFRFELFRGK